MTPCIARTLLYGLSCLLLQVRLGVGGEGPRPAALLDAHLRQAQHYATLPPQETTTALHAFRQELLTRMQAWEARLQQPASQTALLQGIPAPVLQRAIATGHDAAQAQSWVAADASLAVVLALVAQRSPDVQAAQAHVHAMVHRFGQAASLADLTTQFRAFVRELDTRVGPQTHKEMPEMTFAFPALLTLQGQIVEAEVARAALQYQRTLRMVLNETARLYCAAQYASQASKVLRDNQALLTQMDAVLTARLRSGQGSQADALKIQAELATLETQRVSMDRQRLNAVARVNTALLLPSSTVWAAIPATDLQDAALPLDQVLMQVRDSSQEVRLAHKDVELMDVMLRLAESEVLPRGSQGASQLAPSLGAEAGPTRQMMAAFPVRPEVNTTRAGFAVHVAYLDELRVRLRQTQAMAQAAAALAEGQAYDAHGRTEAARRERQTLSDRMLPTTQRLLENARLGYHVAQVPFLVYLEAARASLRDTLALEKARLEHNQMLVELQDRTGRAASQLLSSTP